MSLLDKYESVIGLEVHAQLDTKSKAYSNDLNEYGSLPNTNVSAISLGHPGTLPRLNKTQVQYAIKLGIACNATIRERNEFARKNYFYADLPKGYQITQDTTPICNGGNIEIKLKNGETKSIGLTRIHMEEDSGKSIHDQDPFNTLIDLNRAGVPLLEIVTEPDMRTSEEAYQYVSEIRKLVRYLEICDGNMEEGSLRCDANISVRLKGEKKFGKKVEVKNMNSIRNVQRAIEFEISRQIEEIEKGNTIAQETRSFEAVSGTTFTMRTKEDAMDYRYFPEPDLLPIIVTEKDIEDERKKLPPLPNELKNKYISKLGLSEYDALVITETKEIALYYEELIEKTKNYKAAANWLTGDVKSYLNERGLAINEFPISATKLGDLISLIDSEKINYTIAAQKVFPEMLNNPESSPEEIAIKNQWIQEKDDDLIETYVNEALNKYPDKVEAYKKGKKGVLGLFMGEVMKLSKGKINPKAANQALIEKLEK